MKTVTQEKLQQDKLIKELNYSKTKLSAELQNALQNKGLLAKAPPQADIVPNKEGPGI